MSKINLEIRKKMFTFVMQNRNNKNMEKIWKINVTGENGYSFAIQGELDEEADAILEALSCDLFDDERDARYATAEDITDDEYELEYWKNDIVRV